MFNFLKKASVTINSLTIPTFDWQPSNDLPHQKSWINPENSIALSINFFNKKPDIPHEEDINTLRDFYRPQIVEAKGGLVEVEFIDIDGIKAIWTIFKIPQEPTGMTYLASVTIPFRSHSYVIKLQAAELGTTGMRDSLILEKLTREGAVELTDNGIEGWFQDPYDPSFTKGYLMNKSESPKYDNQFPAHPLTKVRILLPQLISEMKFDEDIKRLKNFYL